MKVIFLDRDGVINAFPGNGNYVTRIKDFRFLPRALKAIRHLTEQGFTLFIVSNQAGVGKGVYSQSKLDQITRHMMGSIKRAKGKIRRIYYCTHRSDHGCDCRKPAIGSIIRAMKLVRQPLHRVKDAFFIGDTESDIETGRRAGCKTIFVLSGGHTRSHLKQWATRPDFIAKDLCEATNIIEHEHSRHPRLRRSRAYKGRGSLV